MKHLSILMLALLAAACKPSKEDPSSPANTVVTAPLNLHLHTYIGATEVDGYDIVYRTVDGRKLSLSMAQVFLSDIELVKFDGSTYAVKDTVLLANPAEQVYKLGNVPVGNYRTIRFKAGLLPAVNAQVPSGTGGPLNNQTMWFTTPAQTENYIFMNCSGKIDTTVAMSAADADMVAFTYKIGTDPQLKQIVMPNQTFTVQPNATGYVHMLADYSILFNGVDLLDPANLSITTAAQNSWPETGAQWPISVTVADNIVNMFRYENE
ncbi:MAG: MbnP family protein [Cytophaga sp.]|uniref:MbnP family protein n=1 Tax=Cytophaga sp. TaxID=29535 RepID=UPI003F7ECEFA